MLISLWQFLLMHNFTQEQHPAPQFYIKSPIMELKIPDHPLTLPCCWFSFLILELYLDLPLSYTSVFHYNFTLDLNFILKLLENQWLQKPGTIPQT